MVWIFPALMGLFLLVSGYTTFAYGCFAMSIGIAVMDDYYRTKHR